VSAPYLGDFAEDSTHYFMWDSNDADGASVTRTADGAIWIYQDDASGTEVQTGITDTEDFDGVTGVHCVKMILTDAFYTTGHDYTVVLKAATIDGQTVNAVLATFSIQNRYMRGTDSANTTVPDAAGTAAGLHGTTDGLIGALVTPDAAGTAAGLHATTDGLIGALVTPDAAGTAAGLHATTDGLIGALVVPDAAGTAAGLHATTDGLIGGLVVPDVAGTAAGLHATTDGLIGTAQTDLDTLTGSDGVTLATAQGNYAPSTHDAAAVKTTIEAVGSSLAQILADTNELQADWADAGRLDAILDTAAAIGGGGVTVDANIVSISDDTGAADTLEAFLDGTGADLSPSMLISKNIPLADAS